MFLRRMRKKMPNPTAASTAAPPTAPPAITPTFAPPPDELVLVGGGLDDVDVAGVDVDGVTIIVVTPKSPELPLISNVGFSGLYDGMELP